MSDKYPVYEHRHQALPDTISQRDQFYVEYTMQTHGLAVYRTMIELLGPLPQSQWLEPNKT
jgi:hypothetical protein